MSDSKSSYGDPVEEPRPVDDVVGSAHEGIADAEAAGRDAVVSDEPVAHESRRCAESRRHRSSPPSRWSTRIPSSTARCTKRTPTTRPRRTRPRPPPRPPPSPPPGRRGPRRRCPDHRGVRRAQRAGRGHVRRSGSRRGNGRRRRLRRPAADLRAGARGAASARQPRRRRRDRPARRPVLRRPVPGRVARHRRCSSGEVTVDTIGSTALAALGTWTLWVPGRGVLHRLLAARRDHQPRSLGRLGHLRPPRRRRRVRRSHPRRALPGAVLDADRERGRGRSSRASCWHRSRSPPSSSAVS